MPWGIHTRSNGFTRKNVDSEPPVVEVLDVDGTASQGGDEVDLGVVEQVVVAAGEAGVGLLLDLENDVAGQDTGGLVTLAGEIDPCAALDATVDVDVEHLAINNRLLAAAVLAAVLIAHRLTLAVAVWAHRLEALDHGTHLAHHRLHTMAVARHALPDGALLTTATLALGADDGALERQLGDLAAVHILEGNLVDVVNGLGLGWAALGVHAAEHAAETAAHTAEESAEEVLSRHATPGAGRAAFKAGLAKLVIYLALLGVGEDLIGVGDFLELLLGCWVAAVLVCRGGQRTYDGREPDKARRNIPGWYLRAQVLYAFLSSCSVAFGETYGPSQPCVPRAT
jgi:hypothetical protein